MKLIGEEGLEMAVIPIHFRTWDVIQQDAADWAERVRQETNAKTVLLKPGKSFSF
jgi:hypothetical protein